LLNSLDNKRQRGVGGRKNEAEESALRALCPLTRSGVYYTFNGQPCGLLFSLVSPTQGIRIIFAPPTPLCRRLCWLLTVNTRTGWRLVKSAYYPLQNCFRFQWGNVTGKKGWQHVTFPHYLAGKSQRRRGGGGGNVSVFPAWRDNAESSP